MPSVKFTTRAQSDLRAILSYTIERWGQTQAAEYMNDLDELFALIVARPGIGRIYPTKHKKWQRFEHGSHVVLYSRSSDAITIQRVMHHRQLLARAAR